MKKFSIGNEWHSILRNKKILIPMIAILFIPILYAGLFLWAFWDPYARLNELPVAIVNEDQGASLNGEKLKLGEDLVMKLKDSNEFKFQVVNARETAFRELKNQKYYMMIEIPSDFSKNATTLLDQKPEKLNLVYIPNESYNFLSAQIGATAIEKIRASVSEKVSETYAETMFNSLGELVSGMQRASDGSNKIDEGALTLKNGTKTLYQSLAELANKSIEFNHGMGQAKSGTNEVANGAANLSSGLAQLQVGHNSLEDAAKKLFAGATELADGTSQINAGLLETKKNLPELVNGAEDLQKGTQDLLNQVQTAATTTAKSANQLNAGILGLQAQLAPMLSQLPPEQQEAINATFSQLAGGSKQIADGNTYLSGMISSPDGGGKLLSGVEKLAVGEKKLQIGINRLADGSVDLNAGANKLFIGQKDFYAGMQTFGAKFAEAKSGAIRLAGGASELMGGMSQLKQGTNDLVAGAGKLKDGAGQLSQGTTQLADGTQELAGKLSDGVKQASNVKGNDQTYKMFASPVQVKNEKINSVPNYGTGFAPYFLSLGLFVGALLLSIVFPIKEPAGIPKNGFSWFLSKFSVMGIVGIIQALIAVAILLWGLDIHVQNTPLFILFAIVTSLTFITLIQVLVTTMNDVGRFVAILILILQLTTSAGTFPLELIPGFLQHFNAFLPMTYTVRGFKSVISSGDVSFMWQNAGILLAFSLLFVSGSILFFRVNHKKHYSAFTNQKLEVQ